MATDAPLLQLVKTAITDKFDSNTATELFDIIEEEGFDDESIWLDIQNEDESSLKDQIPNNQFICIQHTCIQYHSCQSQLQSAKSNTKSSKSKSHTKYYNNKANDISKLKKDYTNWKNKTSETRDIYASQCPGLVNNFPENSFIDAGTLGRDNKIPLISFIADTFNRYRINTFYDSKNKKDISSTDFKNNLPFYRNMEESKHKGTKIHAILSSYHTRFVPKLQFDPTTKYADNIEDIIKYIYAVSQMLEGILLEREQNKNMYDDEQDIIPFQFDLVIIPKPSNTQNINSQFNTVKDVDSDQDSDEDSDSSEDDDDEQEESYGFGMTHLDQIGYIEPRLKKYRIKYENFNIEQDLLRDNAAAQLKRTLNLKFKKIRKGRNGRYVMLVDRRENKLDDEMKKCDDNIWIYSPKCEDNDSKQSDEMNNFDKLDNEFIEESLLFKTKKCLIPGFNDDLNDKHLGSDCKDLITLSFHVLSIDIIRCYLYLNGWGTRFQPIDLIKLLPLYFQKRPPRKSSLFDEGLLNKLFSLKLKDAKFDAWYQSTTKKFKKSSAE